MSLAEWLQVANFVVVVLLAAITGWYAWSTSNTLLATRHQTDATKAQARLLSISAQISAWTALIHAAAHPEGQNPMQKLRALIAELEQAA